MSDKNFITDFYGDEKISNEELENNIITVRGIFSIRQVVPQYAQKMKHIIKQNKGEFLGFTMEKNKKEHIKENMYVYWKCENGHFLKIRPAMLKEDYKGCDDCVIINNIKLAHESAKEHNGKFLSTVFTRVDYKYLWKCENENHESFEAQFNEVRDNNKWCKYCDTRYHLSDIQKLAEGHKGKCLCLEKDFKNNDTDMLFLCANNHEFISRGRYIVAGSWCNICNDSNGEIISRRILEFIYSCEFTKAHPEFLKNEKGYNLELDGYNEELKIAFEYNGGQHYKHIPFFHKTDDALLKIQERDKLKVILCKQNGIHLIVIPYTVNYYDIYMYILERCINIPENTPLTIDYSILEMDKSMNTVQQKMLKKVTDFLDIKGAKLVDKNYINNYTPLTMLCKRNHNVYLCWTKLCEGNFCEKCTMLDNIEKELIKIHHFCRENELELIDDSLYKNRDSVLLWKCVACDDGKEMKYSWSELNRLKTSFSCECRINADPDMILINIMINIASFCEKNKITLLSKFINRSDLLEWKCVSCDDRKEDFLMSWNHLEQRGSYRCDCRKDKEIIHGCSLTALENINNFCKMYDLKLIGTYKKAIIPTIFQCIKCETTTEISWRELSNKRKRFCDCPVEMTEERREQIKTTFDDEKHDFEQIDEDEEIAVIPPDLEEIKQLVLDNEGIYVSCVKTKKKGANLHVKLFCKNYHMIKMRPVDLNKVGCRDCKLYK